MDWSQLTIDRRQFLRATALVSVFRGEGDETDPSIVRYHPGPEAVARYGYGGQPAELKPRPVLADWPSVEEGDGPTRDYGHQAYGEHRYGGHRA